MTSRAFVGLGANLGDARQALSAAADALRALPRTSDVAVSRHWRSAPIDSSGPDYLNAVASLNTALAPFALLAELQRIERDHGRQRPHRNAPRTLDLDLLLYGDDIIDTAPLTVPHPRLHERAFVLRPLAELAPGLLVPGRGSLQSLLPAVAGQRLRALDGRA